MYKKIYDILILVSNSIFINLCFYGLFILQCKNIQIDASGDFTLEDDEGFEIFRESFKNYQKLKFSNSYFQS